MQQSSSTFLPDPESCNIFDEDLSSYKGTRKSLIKSDCKGFGKPNTSVVDKALSLLIDTPTDYEKTVLIDEMNKQFDHNHCAVICKPLSKGLLPECVINRIGEREIIINSKNYLFFSERYSNFPSLVQM